MALLSQMTLNYLENLLVTNPGTQNFTGLGFSDYPNPTRAQVLAAWQSLCDQLKYNSGTLQPLISPDASTQFLTSSYPPVQGTAALPSNLNSTAVQTNPKQLPTPVTGLNTGLNMLAPLAVITNPTQVY